MNIARSIAHHATRSPGRLAVVDDDGRQLTYAQLHDRVARLASLLQHGYGVGPGDRVAYLVVNRLEVPELLAAVIAVGAIAAPLNFRLGEDDLRSILGNARPRVLVTEPQFLELASDVAGEIDTRVHVIDEDHETALTSARPATSWSLDRVAGDPDVLIQYTSGTTGQPKGATFTSAAVLAHAANVALEYDVDASSRLFVSIPHNSATNIQTIPALYRGATLAFGDVRSFDGAAWVERVNRLQATHTQVVPTMLYRVLEAVRTSGSLHLRTMRRLAYGSAPMPPERVQALIETFGSVFLQLYGMIETAAIGTMLRPSEHDEALAHAPERLGSVGQPSFGIDVRVVGEDLEDVAEGQRGEVAFKGPYVMRGYWDAPDLTSGVMVDGWLRSGDVGVYRDGWLYLVDRVKDLIIRGGQNIASKEVEEALYTHEGVLETAVFGVPDPEWGESVAAAVVMRGDQRVDPAELVAATASADLARFKRPEHVIFVDELPRNAIGKVQKGRLRDAYRGLGSEG